MENANTRNVSCSTNFVEDNEDIIDLWYLNYKICLNKFFMLTGIYTKFTFYLSYLLYLLKVKMHIIFRFYQIIQ